MIKKQKHTVHPGDSLFVVIDSFNNEGKLVKRITRLIISKINHSYDDEFIYDDEKSWTRSKSNNARIHCIACNNYQVKAINIITGREKIRGFYEGLGQMKIYNKNTTFKNGKKYSVEFPGRVYMNGSNEMYLKHFYEKIPVFTSFENAMRYWWEVKDGIEEG